MPKERGAPKRRGLRAGALSACETGIVTDYRGERLRRCDEAPEENVRTAKP